MRSSGKSGGLAIALCCIAIAAAACSPVPSADGDASLPTPLPQDASAATEPTGTPQLVLPTTPTTSAAERGNVAFGRSPPRAPQQPVDEAATRELAAAATQAEAVSADLAPLPAAESPCTMDEYCERDRPPPARFVDVAAARAHTCGLLADGRVQCWGMSWVSGPSTYTGTASSRTLSDFVRIDAQGGQTCGLRADKSLFCWTREGGYPRDRSQDWESPRPFEGGSYSDFAVTDWQVCALDLDGRAECWPLNYWDEPLMVAPPPRLDHLSMASIDAGAAHVCGLHHDGAVYCWGSNAADQLNAPAGTSWRQISAGAGHTCALDARGGAACWGDNSFGQSAPPQLSRFSALSSGELHTCGLRLDGTAECWGSDIDGQATPPANGILTALSAGAHHTCGLTAAGESLCWGLNAYGQSTPPPALAGFARLFTDWRDWQGLVACGLRHDGVAQCWGEERNPSLPMGHGTRFAYIVTGSELDCGLLLDGHATCWHHFPEHADSNTSAVVAEVPGDLRFTALLLLWRRACGLTEEGLIRCWGQRQDHHGRDLSSPPAGEHVAVATNGSHACALSHGGIVECWSDYEALPADLKRLSLPQRGSTSIGEHFDTGYTAGAVYRSLALGNADLRGPDGWEQVRVHGCALHQHQTVTCWGANEFGQASPPSGVRFSSISAGTKHTCGITVDGQARCWGANDVGQSTVPPHEALSELHAEGDSTCGLRTTGEVMCWGDAGSSAPTELVPFAVNLPEQHYTDVMALDHLGLFDGTECSTQRLCADAPLTRATMAVWLDRLVQHVAPNATASSAAPIELDDVPTGLWWADHAQRLLSLGVMMPCDVAAQLFCPSDHVSRTGLKQALVRALDIHLRDGTQSVLKVVVAGARAAIGADVDSTCIGRKPSMCHQAAITRGQAATMLNRFREHMERLALPEFTAISADSAGGCGRRSDGTVECWGEDWSGEAYVGVDDRVLDVFYDGHYWCGRTVSREPRCHGWDGYNYSHVHDALDIARRAEVAFGSVYACGIESDKTVSCAGGMPTDGSPWPYEEAALMTSTRDRFNVVAVGYLHRCALRLDGSPVCWGKNEFGEASPPAHEQFSRLALGVSHSCGLRLDASVKCWGYNVDGRSSPPAIRLVTPAAFVGPAAGILGSVRASPMRMNAIAAADVATCGLTSEGTVVCWGTSSSNDPRTDIDDWWNAQSHAAGPPADIEGQVFVSITGRGSYFCAKRHDGSALCWGSHSYRRSPAADARFIEVSANGGSTCGRRTDNTVQCWNSWTSPKAAEGLETITTASTFACGRSGEGTQSCWSLHADQHVPTEAAAGDFLQISGSSRHTCVLRADGSVTCWGSNNDGEATAPAGRSYLQISAGDAEVSNDAEDSFHSVLVANTCGVAADGTIDCWGSDTYGQSTPTARNDFVKVATSGAHACGLRSNGRIECWGRHWQGPPYRSGTTTAAAQYTDVVVGASHGGWFRNASHVCGLRIDGIVDCWGSTYSPNKPYNRYEPDSRSRFTSITSGRNHVCGVRTDGAIECWGIPAFIAY